VESEKTEQHLLGRTQGIPFETKRKGIIVRKKKKTEDSGIPQIQGLQGGKKISMLRHVVGGDNFRGEPGLHS